MRADARIREASNPGFPRVRSSTPRNQMPCARKAIIKTATLSTISLSQKTFQESGTFSSFLKKVARGFS
jgi:hypothetical protein